MANAMAEAKYDPPIKIVDDNSAVWLWNGAYLWVAGAEQADPDDYGYFITTFEGVIRELVEGGYISIHGNKDKAQD